MEGERDRGRGMGEEMKEKQRERIYPSYDGDEIQDEGATVTSVRLEKAD
jgi:hypothetical protein